MKKIILIALIGALLSGCADKANLYPSKIIFTITEKRARIGKPKYRYDLTNREDYFFSDSSYQVGDTLILTIKK